MKESFISLASLFNWIDIIVVTLLIRESYISYTERLLLSVIRTLGVLTALCLARYYYLFLASKIPDPAQMQPAVLNPVLFFLSALLILFIFRMLRKLIGVLINNNMSGAAESFFASALGLFRGIILSGIVLLFMIMIPFGDMERAVKSSSFSGNFMVEAADSAYVIFEKVYPFKIDNEKEEAKTKRSRL